MTPALLEIMAKAIYANGFVEVNSKQLTAALTAAREAGAVILDKEQAEKVREALLAADQDTHEYWGQLVKDALKLLGERG